MLNQATAWNKRDNWATGAAFALCLVIFAVLYFFRSCDDNRFSSWADVFSVVNPLRIFIFLLVALVLSVFLSKRTLPGRPGVLLVAIAFTVAASCWSEPETVVDSARYFTQAKYLELHGASYFLREWGKAIFTWTDMPLMPFLYGIVFRLIGEHRVAIEALNTALFSSAVATLYLLGKELWDAETGFYAGLLLMGIPFIINQTPFMLVDVPSMSFFILSIYFFVLALKRGGFLVPVAAVFIFLAAVSKYTNWVWLSTLPVSAAVLIAQALHGGEKEKARGFLKNAVIAFFFGALLIGLFITAKWEVLKGQMALLVSYQKPGFSRWAESYLSTFLFQCHPFVTVLALGGLYQGIRKKDWDMIIALWPVLLLFLLGIKRSRYTVDVLPMLALMGARGLSALEVRRLKNFIALSVLVSSSVIAVFAYKPFLESTSPVNIKNAAKFIDGLEGTCVRVYTITSPGDDVNLAVTVPMLDLFTGKKCLLHESNSGYLPSSQEIAASPLRFTWEYHTPPFYLPREITGAKEEKNLPIVVISDERDAQYPPELREKIRPLTHSKEFMLEDNIYVFQSLVKVFY